MQQPIFNINNDINEINKDLKKFLLSLKNRLQSIVHDQYFVRTVHRSLLYPLIANERCGLWYVPLNDRLDTCYFKSTDGHTNVWSFSLRRLNLHLLPIILEHGGVVIVDSTRRGKLMPDALLKTIPIWCAVLNSVIFGTGDWLRTPSSMVSKSEHNSIEKLIPSFVASVKQMKLLEGFKLDKPLIPSWYYPGASLNSNLDESVYNICCISASRKVDVHKRIDIRTGNGTISCDYIQGSADDHELWVPPSLCNGKFGADVFWSMAGDLLEDGYIKCGETELIEKINSLYNPVGGSIEIFKLGETGISIGKLEGDAKFSQVNTNIILFHEEYTITDIPKDRQILQYSFSSNKKGSNKFREILPKIKIDLPCTILCDTGRDLSVGMALVLLCLNFDLNWCPTTTPPTVTKTLIKQHLSKISQICKVNPSRSTLQSVNTFLF